MSVGRSIQVRTTGHAAEVHEALADRCLGELLRFDGLDAGERRWAEAFYADELAGARRRVGLIRRRHEPTAADRVAMLVRSVQRARVAATHEQQVMAAAQLRDRAPWSGCSVGG